jgi:hypothetical protein
MVRKDSEGAVLDRVPFGRNRLAALLGGAVAGVAVAAWSAEPATAAAPPPCRGPDSCSGCSTYGTCPNCTPYIGACDSDECWVVCQSGSLIACCDYSQNGVFCVCRTDQGSC